MDPVALMKDGTLFIDYSLVSAVALFFYDYFLTLRLEIKLIWFSRWSYTTILFLLVRYLAFIGAICLIYVQLLSDIPVEICKVVFPMMSAIFSCQVCISDVILAIVTWAVWDRNRAICIGLAFLVIVDAAVRFVLIVVYFHSLDYGPPLHPGFRGCVIVNASRIIWTNFALSMTLQASVLALMVTSAFVSYRSGRYSKTWHVVHRDGIISYIFLFVLEVVNLAIVRSAPMGLITVLSPLEQLIYPVLTARIVLAIRNVTNRECVQTELHHLDSQASTVPLQFLYEEGYAHEAAVFGAISASSTTPRTVLVDDNIDMDRDYH